jgi:excisionase family DNA binding protein
MSDLNSAETAREQHLRLNQARNAMNPNLTPLRTRTDRQLVFTSSQAARYVGVSLATIRRWSDAGHLTCYRTPGGQRRFSRDQLDDFIASLRGDTGGSDDLMPPAAAA